MTTNLFTSAKLPVTDVVPIPTFPEELMAIRVGEFAAVLSTISKLSLLDPDVSKLYMRASFDSDKLGLESVAGLETWNLISTPERAGLEVPTPTTPSPLTTKLGLDVPVSPIQKG